MDYTLVGGLVWVLICLYLGFVRNVFVLRFTLRLNDAIYKSNKHDKKWLWDEYDKICSLEMVLKFWRPLRSFCKFSPELLELTYAKQKPPQSGG